MLYKGDFSGVNSFLIVIIEFQFTRTISFQSLEYSVDDRVMPCIQNYMDADHNVLVAGPAMVGHNFLVGRQCLRGRTSPWNTCAVWCLRKLAILGFPSIGDGVWQDPSTGGVEVLQLLHYVHFYSI